MSTSPIEWLFDPAALAPHGFCLLWEPWLIWSHAAADLAIALAYFSIPVALIVFMRRREDLAFRPVFGLFAAFILLCGAGHLVDLATIWTPVYRLEGVIKIATALVSVATAIALWPLMPKALALPSPSQLAAVNAALAQSEARHRASFLRSPVALHTLDAGGVITGVSDRWLDLLGYARQEVIGRPLEAFLAADSLRAPHSRLLAVGEEHDAERRFRRRDGSTREMLVSTRVEQPAAASGAEPWLLGALIDVTERRRAEAALREAEERQRQTQRMEALGQLAGGIAHDFNNVLQVVSGAVSVIEAAPERTDQVRRLAHLAAEAARRGAGTSNRLLTFARRGDLRATAIDPAGLLAGLVELLEPTLGGRTILAVDAAADLPPLLADRGELETALVNLATNARDAMPQGGRIALTAHAETIAPANPHGLAAGDYIRLDVTDSGTGMDAGTLARAMEPFFTTKPIGKGTGLGLPMARGFAQQSGGALAIESRPGHGTRVSVWLPRAPQPAGVAWPPPPPPPTLPPPDQPAILLVDDEAAVRAVLAAVLGAAGYAVTEADDAQAAIAAVASAGPPALLVTDFAMPGLDGVGLIERLRQSHPALPAILLTGNAGDDQRVPRGGPFVLLHKPIDPAALLARVGSLLAPAARHGTR